MFSSLHLFSQTPCSTFEDASDITLESRSDCAGLELIVADVSFRPEDSHPVALCSTIELKFKLFIEGEPSSACRADEFNVNLFLKKIPVANGVWQIEGVEPFLDFSATTQSTLDFGLSSAMFFQAVFQVPDLSLPEFDGVFCQEFTVFLHTNINAAIGGSGNNVSELAAVSVEYDDTGEFTEPLWNDENLIFAQTITDVIGEPNDASTWNGFLNSQSASPIIQFNGDVTMTQSVSMGSNVMFVLMDDASLIIPYAKYLQLDDGLNPGPNESDFPPTIRGCENMWHSVVVENGGRLLMDGGRIQDGEEGVIVKTNGGIDVDGASFINNHVGIQSEWQSGDAFMFNVSNTAFEVNGLGLLPPMTGATNAQGIFINHQSIPVVLNGNSYSNMAIGVNAQHSNVESEDGTYTNLGAGIFMGSDGINRLAQSHGNFDNVVRAIECRNVETISSGNNMESVGYGYRLYNGRASSFDIHDNVIDAANFGVLMYNWRPGATRNIDGNEISIRNSPATDAAGIRLAGMLNSPSQVINVTDNQDITCANGMQGIHLLATGSVLMQENNIERTSYAQQWDGIFMEGGERNNPVCNSIASVNSGGSSTSIKVAMSPLLEATCNTFNNTHTGIHFIGGYTPATVGGNSFNAHNNGLQIGEGGTSTGGQIGVQDQTGNEWPGAIGGDGLAYLGVLSDAAFSRFIIWEELEATDFDPSTNTPLFKAFDNEDNTFECPACQPPPPIRLNDIKDTDCLIADGTISTTSFPDAQLWTAQRHLYRWLLEDSTLISSGDCSEDFFNGADTTTIGAFEKVRRDMGAVFDVDSTTAQDIDGHQQDLSDMSSQLHVVLDSLQDADAQDSVVLEAQLDSLVAALDTAAADLADIDAVLKDEWMNTAENALLDNNAITATEVYERNQQVFNRIWLELFINGQDTLTSGQLDTMLLIAYQCPYAGGEAVYQARAFLSEDYEFNDSLLCDTTYQPYARKPVAPDLAFTAYPNPGKD